MSPGHAWVGLGSNLGDPPDNLRNAALAIGKLPATRILARSSIYRSEPWGDRDQDDFCNAVLELQTSLEPGELLAKMRGIEAAMGRRREVRRWGPRIIDLDLLVYDRLELRTEHLVLPHPRMCERAFVLVPLMEIAPQLEIPGMGPVKVCLEALGGHRVVRLKAVW